VVFTFATDKTGQPRGIIYGCLATIHLTVKNPQWIGDNPSPAIFAKFIFPVQQEIIKIAFECRTAFLASQRVYLKSQSGHFHAIQELYQHKNDLCIYPGIIQAETFDIDLVKLPVSSFLRPFTSEHGADGKQSGNRIKGEYRMFYAGTDHGSCRFGAQGKVFISPVEKCVHLFFDYIRSFSDTSFK
jgi:hypothetical protein